MAYKKSNPNGQAAMAASEPVVIASDQSAVPVSGTVTANIGTVATLATAAKQDTGNTSIASIDTKTPALGQALAAASVPVILPSATITTLTPPAAITGFATSAKQDTLLTELQAKADLTETQPVSLASVPSHAVTNAGTFVVQDNPQTSGGLTTFHLVGAATDNATNVKASAGQVYHITAFNLNASPRYLKFHNTAGTPTAGAGVVRTVMIPGNTSGSGAVIPVPYGFAFGTGIGITIVTGIEDSNTTAISASEVVIDIGYK
jgi:hypothetical protein